MDSLPTPIIYVLSIFDGFIKATAFSQAEFSITILGLFLTYRAARKSLKATQNLKIKFLAVDTLSGIAKTQVLIDEIRKDIREKNYESLPHLVSTLRKLLIQIDLNSQNLKPLSTKLAMLLPEIGIIEETLDRKHQQKQNLSSKETVKALKILRDLEEVLESLSASQRSKVQ